MEKSKNWDGWKKLLKSISFFAPFTDEQIEELLTAGEIKRYTLHDYIAKEESDSSKFFVIVQGKVSVVKEGTKFSKKHQISTLDAGECFGEMSFLLDGHRTASIIAMLETIAFVMEPDDIEHLSEATQLKIFKLLSTSLAGKLRNLNSHQEVVQPIF